MNYYSVTTYQHAVIIYFKEIDAGIRLLTLLSIDHWAANKFSPLS